MDTDKKFVKTYSYTFSKDQIKQILTYYLIALGEIVPQSVYDIDGYEEYDPDISLQCESEDEMIDRFELLFSFDESDIKSYKEAYNKEGSSLSDETDIETPEELPDNVWTQAQATILPCGKSECPINETE